MKRITGNWNHGVGPSCRWGVIQYPLYLWNWPTFDDQWRRQRDHFSYHTCTTTAWNFGLRHGATPHHNLVSVVSMTLSLILHIESNLHAYANERCSGICSLQPVSRSVLLGDFRDVMEFLDSIVWCWNGWLFSHCERRTGMKLHLWHYERKE